MATRRRTKAEGQGRSLLLRALEALELRGWEGIELESLAEAAGYPLRSLSQRLTAAEDLFFLDHDDLVASLATALREVGLLEALMAYARHLEDERELWLRRLAAQRSDARLRGRASELESDYLACLAAHFRHWGAAGAMGERAAEFEAAALLGALRRAEGLWLEGRGRPQLPVLLHEALVLLWPALYPHQKRNR